MDVWRSDGRLADRPLGRIEGRRVGGGAASNPRFLEHRVKVTVAADQGGPERETPEIDRAQLGVQPAPAGRALLQLTNDDIQSLLRFVGYGNPAGPFWFVGMEEAGDLTPAELLTRAREFRTVDDLARAHALPGYWTDMTRLRPTWSAMSRLVLRLSGEANWRDRQLVRSYQVNRLGHSDGETFLSEALPLPAPSICALAVSVPIPNPRGVPREGSSAPRAAAASSLQATPTSLRFLLRQGPLGRLRRDLRRSALRGSRAGTSPSGACPRRCHRADTLLLQLVHDGPARGSHRQAP
jgi:hypothetical protein